jgi:hypothetical protein
MNDELKAAGFQFIVHRSAFIVSYCGLMKPLLRAVWSNLYW